MKLIVEKTDKLNGEAPIPSSKSHTIRAFIFASLAKGTSKLTNVLESGDTKAAIEGCSALGAKIKKKAEGTFEIIGFNGNPVIKEDKECTINTLNSGTTTNLIASVVALADKKVIIDGDDSIRKRPVQPLLPALNNLGAEALSINNTGCPPIEIKGRLKGGKTTLNCKSSQYISSLLISCPLLEEDTEIELQNICEVPYINMTLKWLDEFGIKYENKDFDKIIIHNNQSYSSFEKKIPADWSSATFLLIAGVMLGDNVLIKGLDLNDTQADKEVIEYLKKMGADIQINKNGILINKSQITGCELDINNTPDALPAIAVLGCYAQGTTIIRNVSHARIKETDRIEAMNKELTKMGAIIRETDDGMIIDHSILKGTRLKGYHDHRIVMALSLAGMIAEGKTTIDTAESINITFPNYTNLMKKLGAKMNMEE